MVLLFSPHAETKQAAMVVWGRWFSLGSVPAPQRVRGLGKRISCLWGRTGREFAPASHGCREQSSFPG